MKCKFCGARIAKGVTVCPECEKDLTKETKPVKEKNTKKDSAKSKKNKKGLKLGLGIAGLVLLTTILTGAVLHFSGLIDIGKWFREQDVFYKDTYTVSKEKARRKSNVVVARIGDYKLTNGELQIYYWNMVSEFVTKNGGKYGSAFVKQYSGMDPEVPLNEQTYDLTTGMTYEQMFLESAIKVWQQQVSWMQLAAEAGLQLTPEQQQTLDSVPASLESDAQAAGYANAEAYVDYFYPGGTVDGYVNYNITMLKGSFCYDALYESFVPTQEEIETFYAQNEETFEKRDQAKKDGLYYEFRNILIPIEGEPMEGSTVYTKEQWEQCREKAQTVLDDFLEDGGTDELFADRAKEVSGDSNSQKYGGLCRLTKYAADSGYSDEFVQWYMAEGRKHGDVGLAKDDKSKTQGYHVMFFRDSYAIWEFVATEAAHAQNEDLALENAMAKWPMEVKYSRIVLGAKDYPEATAPSQ